MADEVLLYRGRPLESYSKEELIQAIHVLHRINEQEKKHHRQTVEILSIPPPERGFFSLLLGRKR